MGSGYKSLAIDDRAFSAIIAEGECSRPRNQKGFSGNFAERIRNVLASLWGFIGFEIDSTIQLEEA